MINRAIACIDSHACLSGLAEAAWRSLGLIGGPGRVLRNNNSAALFAGLLLYIRFCFLRRYFGCLVAQPIFSCLGDNVQRPYA